MNADIRTAIATWIAADALMRDAVEKELAARAVLAQLAFREPVEGTNNADLGDGRVLKGVFRNNYKLDTADQCAKLHGYLNALPKAIRDTVVNWKPELAVSTYKGLEPAHRTLINEVLTITPGRPSLEIVKSKVR